MHLSCMTVLVVLLLIERRVKAGYLPLYAEDSKVLSDDNVYWYPNDDDNITNYFISELKFDIMAGAVVMGAANKLVILNITDLSPLYVYNWTATDQNLAECLDPEGTLSTGALNTVENSEFICNNHIRVYHRLPSNPSQVLVCGTQAVTQPQCRILELSLSNGRLAVHDYDPVTASEGLVSYFPQFSQFGQFRESDGSDTVFLSAGFFAGTSTVARHFSISYKNITMETPSDPNTLETRELFRTINANNNWLRFPVTFVGSHRADYPVGPTQRETDYQFWFIFLRENLVTDDVIYSRLVRVCRNDPGSSMTSDGARYFSTFMKARIFCQRDKPSSLEFTGTLEYIYNSITSFVFSDEGRYYSNDAPPRRLLYGSFTGPSNGPVGSALCVYPADNSIETSKGSGRTKSAFDIFREDITSDVTAPAVEHNFLQCVPDGRPDNKQQLLFINPDTSVEQIGDDPILVLDNVIVTKMVQDSVCVVSREDSSTCVNQDVLFLGLDSGRVMKVVFRMADNGSIEPVIVEDIQLEPDDMSEVTALELREIDDEKFLFVSTETRIYRLPVQRCGRFPQCRCSDCVASCDPYCVYNSESYMCELNSLSPTQPVDTKYRQNIHTGSVEPSCDCPVVTLGPSHSVVDEGVGSLVFDLTTSLEVSITVQTVSGSADSGKDFDSLDTTIRLSTNELITVNIINDVALETDHNFSISLSSDVGVVFEGNPATITIQDNDGESGTQFVVKFETDVECDQALEINEEFVTVLIEGLARGIRDQCALTTADCKDFSSNHIIKPSLILTCSDDGTWRLSFQGEMLSTESALVTTDLLPALDKWVTSGPDDIVISGVRFKAYCTSAARGNCDPPTTSGLSSSDDNSYSAGSFAAVLTLFLITLTIAAGLCVVLVIICWKQRSRYWSSKVGLSREPSNDTSLSSSPTKAPPLPVTATPPATTHATPPVKKSMSYEQAQRDPYSSMKRLVDQRTASDEGILETLQEEEQFPGFAGPDDSTTTNTRSEDLQVSRNSAYESMKREDGEDVKRDIGGEGMKSEGVETGRRENGETRTNRTSASITEDVV